MALSVTSGHAQVSQVVCTRGFPVGEITLIDTDLAKNIFVYALSGCKWDSKRYCIAKKHSSFPKKTAVPYLRCTCKGLQTWGNAQLFRLARRKLF